MCPKCGGRTWDNRDTKKNPKAPDYKCRDRGCDGVVWPPKGQAAAPQKQAFSAGPRIPQMDEEGPAAMPSKLDWLFALYGVCLSEAIQQAKKLDEADVGSTPETVASMTHTLFIQAAKL
jgi:hypothetical protein